MASTNNYSLGRGEIYFAKFKPGTQTPMGERYLGNTPALNLTIESERLDHFNSDRGVREKDDSVLLQSNRTGTLETDNVNPENLALFFLGSSMLSTVVAAVGLTSAFDDSVQGESYQLGTTDATPSGARQVANIVVKNDASPTPVTFALGTDYVEDLVLGRITVLEGGAIADGTNLRITFNTTNSERSRIISAADTIEGALRYVAKNPKGTQYDYFMPWVQFSPNGDFAIKAEEWQKLPFNLEFLKKGALEAIYVDGRPYTPTP